MTYNETSTERTAPSQDGHRHGASNVVPALAGGAAERSNPFITPRVERGRAEDYRMTTTFQDLISQATKAIRAGQRKLAVLDGSIADREAELAAVRTSKATDPSLRLLRVDRAEVADEVAEAEARLSRLRVEGERDEAENRLARRVLSADEAAHVATMPTGQLEQWRAEQLTNELFVMRAEAAAQNGAHTS